MKTWMMLVTFGLLVAWSAGPATAATYKCKGKRVERSGSTKFHIKSSGSGYVVEKSGSTKGKSVSRGSYYHVEVSGSTKAKFDGRKIYKSNGSSWETISTAQRVFDCSPKKAATLWILWKLGYIRE